MKETDQVAQVFKMVGMEISRLPDFIRPVLAKVFTANFQQLKAIKKSHLIKTKKENVNILHKTNLHSRDNFTIDDLVSATHFNKEEVIELLDDYLSAYSNLGYMNGIFIKLTEENLNQVKKTLDVISEKYFEAFILNSKIKRDEFAKRGLECCDFLIKGYQYLNDTLSTEKFKVERDTFVNEFSKKSDLLS